MMSAAHVFIGTIGALLGLAWIGVGKWKLDPDTTKLNDQLWGVLIIAAMLLGGSGLVWISEVLP